MSQTTAQKRAAFRALHEQGCFVIPNPWDVGSALLLQQMGFKALASTSSGSAWSAGHADGSVPLEQVLQHLRTLAAATDLPINADFMDGLADTPEGVAENVRRAVDTGIAGLSIEDSCADHEHPIRPLDDALARITAARTAIDETDASVLLVGRAENFLHGITDLDDTIARLRAYAEAGADCLYAPALATREQIKAVVDAVAPKPVNVLIGRNSEFSLQDMAALGVRRISVGGSLARVAWGAFKRCAEALVDGRFDGFGGAMDYMDLNALAQHRASD